VYVSADRGASWQGLGANLPNVPVHDLQVHPRERELIAGTHGRSVWIVDVLPVQEANAKLRDEAVHLFPLSPLKADRDWRSRASEWFDESSELPKLTAAYWAKADGAATLTVLDADKRPLREIKFAAKRGVNTVEWDLLVDQSLALAAEQAAQAAKAADKTPDKSGDKTGDKSDKGNEGSLAKTPYAEALRLDQRLFATPGTYTVKLALNGGESESKFELKAPEARKPRAKPKPTLRGKDGYDPEAGAAPAPDATSEREFD
jgi:hypothetical protein